MLKALKFPAQFRHWIMQCVTTASYSLNLNGEVFGFFQGNRGLRQRDPLSPLLFTICMEYLTRLLSYTTEDPEFRFHPLCKPIKLTHLMFADDLLLFCKGNVASMMIILRTFSSFSKASGFNMSKGKSNVYFNGVADGIKADIKQVSGLVEGSLPFRYLGVPIKTTRLNAHDCKPLIDKVVNRIRGLGTRKLSYAGRLVLIKSVLKSLHNYWATMFILPSGVITRIESICRNFLWDGGVDFLRSPLVSWKKICKPKQEGGLGLKEDVLWNKAAVGKLVWWIYFKPDHLWVRWINHTYLKGQEWQNYTPTTSSSWYWRKVCQTKESLAEAYQQQEWSNQNGREYTIAKGYEWLREKGEKVQWSGLVWNKWSIPKHSFLAWLYHHGNMNTNAILFNLGIRENDTCYLCGCGREALEHLFFRCDYSTKILDLVRAKLGIRIPRDDILRWRLSRRGTKEDKGAINAMINACMYLIWQQRNSSREHASILRPSKIVEQLLQVLKLRFKALIRGGSGWIRRCIDEVEQS
ncbi:uncharacterized protein LOC141601867 [Silene latifolia]|uniref:uncharacterized protein LOC141601867 n=1 Tax=Silene latifolia TaxID=37657 RepID=UPI003D76A515